MNNITIQDIAKEANVSIATVSRVINGTKQVSPELKSRVCDAIRRNKFKPNSLAKSLVTKKTKMIGIIVPDISNSVFGTLVKGINSVCQIKEYTLIVCESGGKSSKEIELLETLSEKNIDGVLFAGIDINGILVEHMQASKFPVVLVTQETSDSKNLIPTVIHNNTQAIYDSIVFLIQNGHKNIAFICGPEHDFSSGKKRLDGYKLAHNEYNINLVPSYIEHGDFTFESGYACMKKIYEENSILPTAIMVCSDIMAVGAIRFIESVGLNVPDDISVMGFDDSDIAKYSLPELSTVRISYYEEGAQAAKLLFDILGEKKELVSYMNYMPHRIIRRKSVKKIQ